MESFKEKASPKGVRCECCGSFNTIYEHYTKRDAYKNAIGHDKLALDWGFRYIASTQKCLDCGASWSVL